MPYFLSTMWLYCLNVNIPLDLLVIEIKVIYYRNNCNYIDDNHEYSSCSYNYAMSNKIVLTTLMIMYILSKLYFPHFAKSEIDWYSMHGFKRNTK